MIHFEKFLPKWQHRYPFRSRSLKSDNSEYPRDFFLFPLPMSLMSGPTCESWTYFFWLRICIWRPRVAVTEYLNWVTSNKGDILSQSGRLKVQSQGVGRARFLLKCLWKILLCLFILLVAPWNPQHSLACGSLTPISTSQHHMAFFPMCASLLFLKRP